MESPELGSLVLPGVIKVSPGAASATSLHLPLGVVDLYSLYRQKLAFPDGIDISGSSADCLTHILGIDDAAPSNHLSLLWRTHHPSRFEALESAADERSYFEGAVRAVPVRKAWDDSVEKQILGHLCMTLRWVGGWGCGWGDSE